jgi:hypothetical protein
MRLTIEVACLNRPEPEVSDFLVVQFGIADMAVAGNQNYVRAASSSRVLRAHEHFPLILQPVAFDPMAFVIFAGGEKNFDGFEPIRIRLLQVIKVFFPREACALGICFENSHRCVVLVVAQAGFHLGAQRANQTDVIIGAAPIPPVDISIPPVTI